jgi:tRNA-2-methylthio-N6-dimethylallyladenosine synthase
MSDASFDGGPVQLSGRTWCDRIVVFEGPERLIGEFLPIEVEETNAMTLFGRVATTETVRVG